MRLLFNLALLTLAFLSTSHFLVTCLPLIEIQPFLRPTKPSQLHLAFNFTLLMLRISIVPNKILKMFDFKTHILNLQTHKTKPTSSSHSSSVFAGYRICTESRNLSQHKLQCSQPFQCSEREPSPIFLGDRPVKWVILGSRHLWGKISFFYLPPAILGKTIPNQSSAKLILRPQKSDDNPPPITLPSPVRNKPQPPPRLPDEDEFTLDNLSWNYAQTWVTDSLN